MFDRSHGPRTEIETMIFSKKVELAMLRIQPELIHNYDGVEAINNHELYLHGLINALTKIRATQERNRQGVEPSPPQRESMAVLEPRTESQPILSLTP